MKLQNKFMASFYGWGSTASRLQPLCRGSLLYNTQFPEIRDTWSHAMFFIKTPG